MLKVRTIFFLLLILAGERMIDRRLSEVSAKGISGRSKGRQALSLQQLKRLHQGMKRQPSLSVSFSQKSFKSLRKKTLFATGEALFSQPRTGSGMFRWKLLKPRREEWVYDGRSLLHFHPVKNRAIRYGSKARKLHELRRLVDIVLNLDVLLEDYHFERAYREGHFVWVFLKTKKDRAEELLSVAVKLDLKKSYISWVKLNLKRQNYTEFSFFAAKSGPIPKNSFSLPKGVKISEVLR